jgi:hypothetical protein
MPAVEGSRWLGTPMAGKPTQRLYPARLPRRPVRTGRVGRPPPRVPEGLSLTQTIKHRDERGRLLEVERRTTIGTAAAAVQQPCSSRCRCISSGSMGWVFRDRLAALTRKTHAFAKTAQTWDALFGLSIFEHNWLRNHPALRGPSPTAGRRYERRTPAMEVGLTDHRWSWREFLTTKLTISY